MRLPNPLPYLVTYAVHIAWCVSSAGWVYAAWHAADRVSMIISAYTGGICGCTAFYHGLVMRLARNNKRLAESIDYQQEALEALMTMKAAEVSEALAVRMQGVIAIDSPTITRH